MVGDPRQLEPVITLPSGAQDALLGEFEVAAEWLPSAVSVQAVAGRQARFGTLLPAGSEDRPVWVGAPLRVHRRCDQPTFAICNAIAYDGLMVFGTAERGEFHGRSIWYDVPSPTADGEVSWWVGTVHAMQGKEADVVILVLGSDPRRDGARRWAVEQPNLLNVAVSRARRRLYVIGDHDQWKSLRNIRILANNLDRWS